MKLWIDDIRPAPEGYIWLKSTNAALDFISAHRSEIEEISLDHDAGDYVADGGDYIAILNELERISYYLPTAFKKYKFSIHSANPVGAARMKQIIKINGWKEI